MKFVRITLCLLIPLVLWPGCQSNPPQSTRSVAASKKTKKPTPPPPNPAPKSAAPSATSAAAASPVNGTATNLPPGTAVVVGASTNTAVGSVGRPPTAAELAELPDITYSAKYDQELQFILKLAKQGHWEEAEAQITVLARYDPTDPMVQRVQSWVAKQRALQRESALEDKIRRIDAQNSAFNPTVLSLLGEQKDRGLPPRKDVRDTVEKIEATPYIPDSYGKTIYQKGELFDFETKEGRMAKILEKEVSVQLDNATLESIIFNLGQAEGVNFVADKALPAFKQTLSVNMSKVKLSEFLLYVGRNFDLQFQVGSDLIWIVDGKDPKKLLEETRFYRLRRGFVLPAIFGPLEVQTVTTINPQGIRTVTENAKVDKFVNDGTPDLPGIEKAITNFFTGKIMLDQERNLIVARGTREQLKVLEDIIQSFDKPIQQVLIEARFITVTEPAFMQLGVLWETGRPPGGGDRAQTDFTGLISESNLSKLGVGLGIQTVFTNVLGRYDLSATLSALQQTGESQTLSAPRLTLLNNRPATIRDGKVQYYYEEYQVKQQITTDRTTSTLVPSGKPTKLNSGVTLDVMASIGGDGRSILLALRPEVNQDVRLVDFATVSDFSANNVKLNSFTIRLPEYRTQNLSTRVAVKSGQTVVMGGVLERNQATYVESVPVLGSLPVVGALFRRRTEIDQPRYLLIFVTATLLSETGEYIIVEDEPARK